MRKLLNCPAEIPNSKFKIKQLRNQSINKEDNINSKFTIEQVRNQSINKEDNINLKLNKEEN